MKPISRSFLHAQEAIGVGTPEVESLLSYFCRLAVSHAVSTADLARLVVKHIDHDIRQDFEWQQRNLSGISESARNWAAWLAAATGVERLDLLTLTNWSSFLPAKGLSPRRSHWCPHCLAEDRKAGNQPYFRLSWEIGPVEACHRHKVQLVDTCPHCGRRHVRHDAGIVLPGWCTQCGGFLGDADAPSATPGQLWVARQVGQWIASQTPAADFADSVSVTETLNTLILGLDGGQPSRFAKRIGLAKSTVHGWLRDGNLPTIQAYLAMAAHSGLSLNQVMRGELTTWAPNTPDAQIALPFDLSRKAAKAAPRQLDWDAIKRELETMLKLPEPISVAEAGRRLDIDDRHLYLRANALARALGEKWKRFQDSQKAIHRDALRTHLQDALPELMEAGLPFNLTQLRHAVPAKVLNAVEGAFDVIREVRDELDVA
ncbi:TetR family transcriptional regulator [Parasulfuritortus cantonensis]|uniref:TetR family transcriptional regulator n=1 Tax=Parasulfuritortus cantonensis TaxID=2528202 RepID=A0A4V2NVM0_9PROT|nr:TniQ family protein [Parasulfuritortus cantonensis]TCJ13922.1 TetR family transcriptional regulator [Parasulfuritortus cantonensis]